MVVARNAVSLTWENDRPVVARYDARLLGYRSLPPILPEADGRTRRLGWDAALDLRGNRDLALAAAIGGAFCALLPLWERDELADHLLASVGVGYELQFPTAQAPRADHPHGLGLPLALEYRRRLGGLDNHRSHLAARLFGQPGWIVAPAPAAGFVWQAGAAAELHLALRATPVGGHDPALLITGEIRHDSPSPLGA